jgi:hypothetical protein
MEKQHSILLPHDATLPPLVPRRRERPVSQHCVDGIAPFLLEAGCQLGDVLLGWRRLPPHLWLDSLGGSVGGDEAVVAHLDEAKPGQVPAAVAVRVGDDARVRLLDDVATEGVVAREPAELQEELLAGDVVDPGRGHGLLKGARVLLVLARGCKPLDAAELSQSVDAMRRERPDELLYGGLDALASDSLRGEDVKKG